MIDLTNQKKSKELRDIIDKLTVNWINTLDFIDIVPHEEFLEKMGIDKNLLKEFTEYFGMPLTQLKTQMRLEYAMKLVTDYKLSIQAASKLAGYIDDSNFRKAFFNRYGISPKEMMDIPLEDNRSFTEKFVNYFTSDNKRQTNDKFTQHLRRNNIKLYLTKEYFPLLNLRALNDDDFVKANIKKINFH